MLQGKFPGVVCTTDWRTAPDGDQYRTFWSPSWQMLTEAQAAKDLGLSESTFCSERDTKWALVAIVGSEVVMVLPGCEVKAWIKTAACPGGGSVYDLRERMQRAR